MSYWRDPDRRLHVYPSLGIPQGPALAVTSPHPPQPPTDLAGLARPGGFAPLARGVRLGGRTVAKLAMIPADALTYAASYALCLAAN